MRACGELGIDYLTVYAFSIENWNRPKAEVSALMHLLEFYLKQEIPELNIPTGVPIRYRIDSTGKVLEHGYLGLT